MKGKLRIALEFLGLLVVAALVVLAAGLLSGRNAAPTAAPGQAESYPPPATEEAVAQATGERVYPPPRPLVTEEPIPTDEPTPTVPAPPTPLPTPKVTPIPVASPPFIPLPADAKPEPFTLVYWSGNTLRAINSDGKNDRLLVDIKAKTQFDLAGPGVYVNHWQQGSASPDGKKLAFVVYSTEDILYEGHIVDTRLHYSIHLYDFAADETSLVIEEGVEPVWSPDGRYVAYHETKKGWGSGGLWVLDTLTDERREIYSTNDELERYVDHISWSPDGQQLLFIDNVFRQSCKLMIANMDGKTPGQELLPGDLGWKATSQWSPDGEKILYLSGVGKFIAEAHDNLWIMNPDGSDQRQLTFDMGVFGASWSPDGNWIAFSGYVDYEKADYDRDIWIINRNGENPLRLTLNTNGKSYRLAAWSPDGTQILFYNHNELTEVWSFSLVDGRLIQYPVAIDNFIIVRQPNLEGEK